MAKFCPECGNSTSDTIKFCSECGFNLTSLTNNSKIDNGKNYNKKYKNNSVEDEDDIENETINRDVNIDISNNSDGGISSTSLPGGQILTKGEILLKQYYFMSSLTTFYIESGFAVTNKRFVSNYPNIVMGIFPMGLQNTTFSLKQISGVQIDISYKIFRIIISILLFFTGLSLIGSGSITSLIFIIIGILLFGSGIQTYIRVTTSGGVAYCPIIFWQKDKATILVQELNRSIAENT